MNISKDFSQVLSMKACLKTLHTCFFTSFLHQKCTKANTHTSPTEPPEHLNHLNQLNQLNQLNHLTCRSLIEKQILWKIESTRDLMSCIGRMKKECLNHMSAWSVTNSWNPSSLICWVSACWRGIAHFWSHQHGMGFHLSWQTATGTPELILGTLMVMTIPQKIGSKRCFCLHVHAT